MNPELITAVKERLDLGYSDDKIKEELKAAGYDDLTIEGSLVQARVGSAELSTVAPVPASTNTSPSVLPGVSDLLSGGFSFVAKRIDLLLMLALPVIALALIGFVAETFAVNVISTIILISLAYTVVFVFYIFVRAAALYIAIENSSRSVSLSESFTWARKNILGLIWINILTFLVVYGGFVLLIVPGIVVSILLFFSQYVYAKEGLRGLSALLRSREIVKGNWGTVFFKLLLIGLLMLLVVILFLVLLGFLIGLVAEQKEATDLIFLVVVQLLSAVVQLVYLNIGVRMFEILRQARPYVAKSGPEEGRTKYKVLAWIGLFLPILALFALVTLFALGDAREKGQMALLEKTLIGAQSAAEVYYMENENSYSGVCNQIRPAIPYMIFDCVDSSESWAMEGVVGSVKDYSGQLCVDSNSSVAQGSLDPARTAECIYEQFDTDAKERASDLRSLDMDNVPDKDYPLPIIEGEGNVLETAE